jgi:hypothetical protein
VDIRADVVQMTNVANNGSVSSYEELVFPLNMLPGQVTYVKFSPKVAGEGGEHIIENNLKPEFPQLEFLDGGASDVLRFRYKDAG